MSVSPQYTTTEFRHRWDRRPKAAADTVIASTGSYCEWADGSYFHVLDGRIFCQFSDRRPGYLLTADSSGYLFHGLDGHVTFRDTNGDLVWCTSSGGHLLGNDYGCQFGSADDYLLGYSDSGLSGYVDDYSLGDSSFGLCEDGSLLLAGDSSGCQPSDDSLAATSGSSGGSGAGAGTSGTSKKHKTKPRGGIEYADESKQAMLDDYIQRGLLVVVDPGRRDIAYMRSINGKCFRFTACERDKIVKRKHYRFIREKALKENPRIGAALRELSLHSFKTLKVADFNNAVDCWARHVVDLLAFYGHAGVRTRPAENSHWGRSAGDVAAGDVVGEAPVGGVAGAVPTGDTARASDNAADAPVSTTGVPAAQPVAGMSKEELARRLAANCSLPGEPLFMKLRSNAFINSNKADAYLVRKICELGGNGKGEMPLVVRGNWPGGAAKHHDPQRSGLCLCLALKNLGVPMLLIDEFRTSKLCSLCDATLVHPLAITSPRPPTDSTQAERSVPCHGLLACTSQICSDYVKQRLHEKHGNEHRSLSMQPTIQAPKRQKDGYSIHRLNQYERRNLRPDQKGREYKKTNRVRTYQRYTSVQELFAKNRDNNVSSTSAGSEAQPELQPEPESSGDKRYVRYVNRDRDAVESMLNIIYALADGQERPEPHCRPAPAKGKKRADAPEAPPDGQPESSKRRRR
ncbi:hypothetical protein H4R19_003065 [Coemansia spiralis]|nr:hypothetical protein H4R19_003065 [Coemansia spiralis]